MLQKLKNQQSIRILRANEEYDPSISEATLLYGQPFYSKQNKQLYIGEDQLLKDTLPVTSWLQAGTGLNSVQSYVSLIPKNEIKDGDDPIITDENGESIFDTSIVLTGGMNPRSGSIGKYATTFGLGNTAAGRNNLIAGTRNYSYGNENVTFGQGNYNKGYCSLVTGANNISENNSNYSNILGEKNSLSNLRISNVFGSQNTGEEGQHVLLSGRFNTAKYLNSTLIFGTNNKVEGLSNNSSKDNIILGSDIIAGKLGSRNVTIGSKINLTDENTGNVFIGNGLTSNTKSAYSQVIIGNYNQVDEDDNGKKYSLIFANGINENNPHNILTFPHATNADQTANLNCSFNIDGNLKINKDAIVSGNSVVSGDATFNNNVIFNKNVVFDNINGSITLGSRVKGKTTFTEQVEFNYKAPSDASYKAPSLYCQSLGVATGINSANIHTTAVVAPTIYMGGASSSNIIFKHENGKVNTPVGSNGVPRLGIVRANQFIMSEDPTEENHLTKKKYVDDCIKDEIDNLYALTSYEINDYIYTYPKVTDEILNILPSKVEILGGFGFDPNMGPNAYGAEPQTVKTTIIDSNKFRIRLKFTYKYDGTILAEPLYYDFEFKQVNKNPQNGETGTFVSSTGGWDAGAGTFRALLLYNKYDTLAGNIDGKATIAEYASEDISKGTIEERLTNLANNSGGSGIRTLDTTPTLSTVGYVGEIVQVKDGTAYQCNSVGLKGKGSPSGVVSGIYYQIYSDTLNKKMYWQNSSTNRTQWSELKASDYPYVEQAYTWFELPSYQNLIKQQKKLRVQTIAGSGSGAGEEIGLGELDRRIDFRIGGSWGFRMQGLAGANNDNVVFLPNPSTSNGRVDKTDLGTETYPFRKLHLNDGVYVNGVKLGGGTKLYKHHISFTNGIYGYAVCYSTRASAFTSYNDFISGDLVKFEPTNLLSLEGTYYDCSIVSVVVEVAGGESSFLLYKYGSGLVTVDGYMTTFTDTVTEL